MRKLSLAICLAGLAVAQQPRSSTEPPPDFPPSYEVHISPSGTMKPSTSLSEGGNYWVARGYDLKTMMAELWRTDTTRLDIGPGVDADKHYDFAMVLPRPEDRTTVYAYVRQAIQDQFPLRITIENEPKDVYVLTAPNGLLPAVKMLPTGPGGSYSASINLTDHSLSGQGITMEEVCQTASRLLDRLVVDETRVSSRFDVDVQGDGRGRSALIAMLQNKVGLVLTPAHRDVEMLVVRPQ